MELIARPAQICESGANVVLNGRSEILRICFLCQLADYGDCCWYFWIFSNGEDAQRMVAEAIEKLEVLMFWSITLGLQNAR